MAVTLGGLHISGERKGLFRLAVNLLRPATVTVCCSKNRKFSNYLQQPSPMQWTTTSFDLPPEGSAQKVNNASTLQFKTKYVFVFKTI